MTDTDRTLLEKAARAAGITIVSPIEKFIAQPFERHEGGFIVRNDRGGDSSWNPLGDDGDALRLAVKLRLEIVPVDADYIDVCLPGSDPFVCACERSDDRCAATRRAIVRAAASLGEQHDQ